MTRVAWFFVVLLVFACAINGSWFDTIIRLAKLLPYGANW